MDLYLTVFFFFYIVEIGVFLLFPVPVMTVFVMFVICFAKCQVILI
jgi:hypothetical protein